MIRTKPQRKGAKAAKENEDRIKDRNVKFVMVAVEIWEKFR
jgi:hypothetical protein